MNAHAAGARCAACKWAAPGFIYRVNGQSGQVGQTNYAAAKAGKPIAGFWLLNSRCLEAPSCAGSSRVRSGHRPM